ncbi:MAG: PAC2 family protein [Chloroflexi bacterium]|nr:PAC2 family protein [Chloroflexota bacterium]
MAYLQIHREPPALRDPVLIVAFAGWNDASEVATWSARYLVQQWAATQFAEIDGEEFYVFSELRPHVRLDSAGQRFITWPANEFYYHRSTRAGRDFLVLLGIEPQLKWKTFITTVLDVVRRFDVRIVFTLGGLLAAVPHSVPARLTASSTDASFAERLADLRTRGPGYQGPTGIVGVLNSRCQQEGFATASMWGNVPHYLQATPNFKVAAAMLRRLDHVLDLKLNLASADALAARFEAQVAEAVERSPEIASYVRQLEEQAQEEAQEEATAPPPPDLPSGDVLVQELEEFLRERREQDEENPSQG